MKKIVIVFILLTTFISFSQERDEKKEAFLNEVFSSETKDSNLFISKIVEYKQKFNVTGKDLYLDYLLISLMSSQLANNEIDEALKNETNIFNQQFLASIYNDYAWKVATSEIATNEKNSATAEKLSLKSLEIVKSEKLNIPNYNAAYAGYADTYALLLFKQKKYKEAFKVQDEISKIEEIGIDGKERLAEYTQFANGASESKKYIESEINKGFTSQKLIDRLKSNYKELKISDVKFKKINTQAQLILDKEKEKSIGILIKDNPAPDFELTNLKNEKVKLSDLKGKVVVLDFWATWCGPCKASFPKMQDLVIKYSTNHDVVFLFVNVWEKGETIAIFDKVTQFINDKKYPFNVVFDYSDSVSKLYNIQGVPSKIVINKNGNFTSSNAFLTEDEVESLIQDNLK